MSINKEFLTVVKTQRNKYLMENSNTFTQNSMGKSHNQAKAGHFSMPQLTMPFCSIK